MTRHLAAVCLALVLAAPARADDAGQRAALERAQETVARALEALRGGRAADAADLLANARSAAPGQPVVTFDHGVALAASDREEEAREAYRQALQQGDAADAAVAGARHNLALSHLAAARRVATLLRTPGALEDAVRAQGAPGGEPLSPATVTMLASQLRTQAIGDGLDNARTALDLLRDGVRSSPGDADAVRNLILAQRVRRFLEDEKRKQEEQESRQEDQGDENAGGDQQESQDQQGEQGQQGEDGQEEQQPPSTGDGQEQPSQPQAGRDGESSQDSERSETAQQGEPRDLGREEAERLLEQLLDEAALRARQVEQIRAARLRRGAVEKDW